MSVTLDGAVPLPLPVMPFKARPSRRDELIIPETAVSPPRTEGKALRADLRTAGVTREELFARGPNVKPLRFHDLRATFVQWALRAGESHQWIADRTGHMPPAMIENYARAASTQDLEIEPFPDLTGKIPEIVTALDGAGGSVAAEPVFPTDRGEQADLARRALAAAVTAVTNAGATGTVGVDFSLDGSCKLLSEPEPGRASALYVEHHVTDGVVVTIFDGRQYEAPVRDGVIGDMTIEIVDDSGEGDPPPASTPASKRPPR